MKDKKLISVVVVAVISALLGLLVGRLGTLPQKAQPPVQNQSASPSLSSNPLFKSQTATFQGKITAVSGKTLQVESDNGQKGELEAADKILIYKFAPGSKTTSASSDLKIIEAGKQVLVSLELKGGKYRAVSITYPPTPINP